MSNDQTWVVTRARLIAAIAATELFSVQEVRDDFADEILRHLTPDARWQALKDYLAGHITADEAVRVGMVNDGETELAAPFGGLVSANRATLAKMRELEAGK